MYDHALTGRSAWYELSYKDAGTLVIRVHRLALEFVYSNQIADSDVVRVCSKRFGLNFFLITTEQSCGFEGALKPVPAEAGRDPDWVSFECALPSADPKLPEREVFRQKWAVRCTLNWMFNMLHMGICNVDTQSNRFQLVHVEGMRLEADMHGGALSVSLTPEVTRWVAKYSEVKDRCQEIEGAMHGTYGHIYAHYRSLYNGREFRAYCRKPNRLYLQIPGDACNLGPDVIAGTQEEEEGYILVPHNVDSGLDQLTFIMGVAKLHDLVRQGLPS